MSWHREFFEGEEMELTEDKKEFIKKLEDLCVEYKVDILSHFDRRESLYKPITFRWDDVYLQISAIYGVEDLLFGLGVETMVLCKTIK